MELSIGRTYVCVRAYNGIEVGDKWKLSKSSGGLVNITKGVVTISGMLLSRFETHFSVAHEPREVYFFPNGSTAVTDGNEQISELQESWVVLFGNFLQANGYDPTSVRLNFANGEKAKFFRTDDGRLSWTFDIKKPTTLVEMM